MYLVTGATGNVGSEVVAALLDASAPVRALVRRPDASLPGGVERAVGDLNDPRTLDEALTGVEALFLLPGYDGAADLLARARAAGVKRVVLLSGGSAAHEDLTNAISRYMTLAERGVRDSGLPWTFLRPRAFMSNALRWLPQLREGDTVRVHFPDVAVACIDPRDIAAVAALALTSSDHEGRVHELTGPEALRPAEQVAILGEVLGRDLEAVELSPDETRAELEASMPTEYVEAFFRFYVDRTLDETTLQPDLAQATGRSGRTFRQWAEAHVGDFA